MMLQVSVTLLEVEVGFKHKFPLVFGAQPLETARRVLAGPGPWVGSQETLGFS